MKWLLNFWHDLFYAVESKKLERFALTCRRAVEDIESTDGRPGLQLALHLSLCDSCRRYYGFSKAFRQQLKENPMLDPVTPENPTSYEDLTSKLLAEFATNKK